MYLIKNLTDYLNKDFANYLRFFYVMQRITLLPKIYHAADNILLCCLYLKNKTRGTKHYILIEKNSKNMTNVSSSNK